VAFPRKILSSRELSHCYSYVKKPMRIGIWFQPSRSKSRELFRCGVADATQLLPRALSAALTCGAIKFRRWRDSGLYDSAAARLFREERHG
jgi:hypothetical protein